MSADWHFDITLGGHLDADVMGRFLDAARAVDMVPFLSRTTSDGMEEVLHSSVEDLVDVWMWEGGAFQIESPDHYVVVSSSDRCVLMSGPPRRRRPTAGRPLVIAAHRRPSSPTTRPPPSRRGCKTRC